MDTDGDGTPDCNDACLEDKTQQQLDSCGCGIFPGIDNDGDGVPDCTDSYKEDKDKATSPSK